MYTGTPKGDHKLMSKGGTNMFDENFVGANRKLTRDHEANQNDKLFKLSKNLIDKKESELFSSRAPMHQGIVPKQKATGRGNSPATGAIAGQASSLTESKTGVQSESKLLVGNSQNNLEDSFQKLYSKELDLDEDEVPLILHELNDSAIHFISKDQWDRALSLLQKAQTLLDRLMFQLNTCDRFLIQCTMHNMALCFQKMGAIEECSLCLDACLTQINQPNMLKLYQNNPGLKLKKLKYECKIHMQVCALLSQLNRHQEALCHAKQSVQISQYMMLDMLELCEVYNQKVVIAKQREQQAQELISKGDVAAQQFQNQFLGSSDLSLKEIQTKLVKSDLIYFDDQVSMLERTAHKYYPIIKEAVKRMVKHKEIDSKLYPTIKPSKWVEDKIKELKQSSNDNKQQQEINMKVLLGYLNQSEWMYLLNIGNIMQITPLTIHDLLSNPGIEIELARDSVIEKMSYLAVSYFCVSTELRFLVNLKDNPNVDPVQIKSESEYWHGKALELSCTFLPSESPLVSHILTSYNKHHAPVKQVINEDLPETDDNINLKVIRPLNGIDQAKQQPLVKANKHMHIALSPLPLSPNNYTSRIKKGTFTEFCEQTKVSSEGERTQKQVQQHYQTQQQEFSNENFNESNLQPQKNSNYASKQPVEEQPKNILPHPGQTKISPPHLNIFNTQSSNKSQQNEPRIDLYINQAQVNQQNFKTYSKPVQSISDRKADIGKIHLQEPMDLPSDQLKPILEQARSNQKSKRVQETNQSQTEIFQQHDDKQDQINLVQQLMELSLINKKDDTQKSFQKEIKQVAGQENQDHQKQRREQQNDEIKFLKDTKIDNKLLTNRQPTERSAQNQQTMMQQQTPARQRPKTSENYTNQQNRPNVMVQHAQQQLIQNTTSAKYLDLSGIDGKFKSSQNTQIDTIDAVDMARNQTMLGKNDLVNHTLEHTDNQPHQPLMRPYTQQNFYEVQRNQALQGYQHQQNQQQMLRQPASANLSSSVTSGLTSHNSVNQSRQINQQFEERQFNTQQQIVGASQGQVKAFQSKPSQEPEFNFAIDQAINSHRDIGQNLQYLNSQYNTQTNCHITPKNKADMSTQHQFKDVSHPQMTRYKHNNNNQQLNSGQNTAERQSQISSHRGSNPNTKDVHMPRPKISQREGVLLNKKHGNSVENKKNSEKTMQQQMPYAQRQIRHEIPTAQAQSSQHREQNDLMKQQARKNQSASGSRERKDIRQRVQPNPMISSANNLNEKMLPNYQSLKAFEHKKSIKEVNKNPLNIGASTNQNSPNKEQRTNLEIQTKQKLVKQSRTNVQTPTQGSHPVSVKQSHSKQTNIYAVNQLIMQAQNERSNSGEHVTNQTSNSQSAHKSQRQTQAHQHQHLIHNAQVQQNTQEQHATERHHGKMLNTAPASRGNSAKTRKYKNVQLSTLNQSLNQRYSTKKQINAEELHLLQINQGKQHKSGSQQKSRNAVGGGLNGISKTAGVNAAGALVSHRVSVNHTFVDDITNINAMHMQIQQKLGNLNGKTLGKMKLKMPKSQEKLGNNYQTASQGQMLTQRSNKLQINMKAVQPGQLHISKQGGLHSVRNVEKPKMTNLAANSSQKFIIDHNNPNLNLNQFHPNTYTLTSLENTNQDINGMNQTNNGFAFPGTPNIQSSRGSVQNAHPPSMVSNRSIQSSVQQSQQTQMSNQKQITIKKIMEQQQMQQNPHAMHYPQKMENSYELLQRQKQMNTKKQ